MSAKALPNTMQAWSASAAGLEMSCRGIAPQKAMLSSRLQQLKPEAAASALATSYPVTALLTEPSAGMFMRHRDIAAQATPLVAIAALPEYTADAASPSMVQ